MTQADGPQLSLPQRRRPTFIRQWRKHRGLTLEQLAARLNGMAPSNLSMLERGERGYTQDTLESIADALGTDVSALLTRNPPDEGGLSRAYLDGLLERTTKAREAKGWTQDFIANALGIKRERYRTYEKRSPLPHCFVESFCALTDIDLYFFVTGRKSPPVRLLQQERRRA
jgi:transcriptional regulator with XRE-family HTH domain